MTQIDTREDYPDIIHFENSSDLPLFTSLNDLHNATLYIDGQSTEVDAPPDIIDVVDEDDDIIDDEDALPHNLADFDDEDLINVDDDDVARSHDDNGGGEDRLPTTLYTHRLRGCFANQAGRLNTRHKTLKLSLKEITDTKGPISIRFEVREKQTLMPLGKHAAHWSSCIGEFDLRPHMESLDWTKIHADIQQHLQKAYNTNKAAFKAHHWVIDPTTGTYNVKKIRRARPQDIMMDEWDKQSSTTQEYPLLIDTFFVAHTVNGEFLWDEDRCIYEEMRRLETTGNYTDDEINRLARGGKQRGHILDIGKALPAWATTSPSTPAHESTLNSLHKNVDFMMSLFKSDSKYSDMFSQFESGGASGSGGCVDDEESADDQDDEDEDGDGDS
nr:F-box domain, leucine-rich repeat domain, L domain-like protein [Tanacetum cinerariifolium]